MHARTGGSLILTNQPTDLDKRHDDHPLALRRKELRLMQQVYDAENRLLQRSDFPDRDKIVVETCIKMIKDPDATPRDKRSAVKMMESVNRRLDTRDIRLIENATERLKIKASVAADTVRTWQPNGYQAPPPDPELQALIDGAGTEDDDTGQPES